MEAHSASQAEAAASSSSAPPPKKRPSTSTGRQSNASRACDACFKRKIRCDQESPACSQCRSRDLACAYGRPHAKRGRPSTVVNALRSPQASVLHTASGNNNHEPAIGGGNGNEQTDGGFPINGSLSSAVELSDMANSGKVVTTLDDVHAHALHSVDPGLQDSSSAASFGQPVPWNSGGPSARPTAGPSQVQRMPTTSAAAASSAQPLPDTISPLPASGLEEILPMSAMHELVDLFEAHLWPQLPILHLPKFREELHQRQDLHSASFFTLALNISAATCMTCRALPQPPTIRSSGLSWEELAWLCNSKIKQRKDRIHDMARAGSLTCLQNIILVAQFEDGNGSPVAERLWGEAERIARGIHLGLEIDGVDAVEAELRRRIFWVLYINDKCRSILYRQTMALRKDEANIALPDYTANHDGPGATSAPSSLQLPGTLTCDPRLDAFFYNAKVCLVAEDVLLRWRHDAKARTPVERSAAISQHFYQSLEDLIKLDFGHGQGHNAGIRRDPTSMSLKGALMVEIYHRYATLLSEEKVSIVHNMVNAAIKMTHELSNASKDSLRVLGPAPLTMLGMTQRKLDSSMELLKDPLTRYEASSSMQSLAELVQTSAHASKSADLRQARSRLATPTASGIQDNLAAGLSTGEGGNNDTWSTTDPPQLGVDDFSAIFTAEPGVASLDFLHSICATAFPIPGWPFPDP